MTDESPFFFLVFIFLKIFTTQRKTFKKKKKFIFKNTKNQ